MAGLPWVKVATDFADHPKAFALAQRLGDPRAPLHLPAVWGHFARRYADGSMPDTEDATLALERAALWQGAPGALVTGLVEVGLLERKGRRLRVHDWDEWQEGHARKLERDRERQRAKRAETQGKARATVALPSRDRRAGEEREMERRGDPAAARARGAAGELLKKVEVAEAHPPRAPVVIADLTELGPLGAEFRGRLERELGHGLAVASADRAEDVRAELEQLLERPEHGGVERALSWTLATLAARRRSGADEPGSVAYLLPLLREMPPREPGALERIRAGCPEWAAVLEAASALPASEALWPDTVERWLHPLSAVFRRGELHLEAPDEGHRQFVAECYLGGLRKLAQETIGPHVLVHLHSAEPERSLAGGS
jgi:hypothetical protein